MKIIVGPEPAAARGPRLPACLGLPTAFAAAAGGSSTRRLPLLRRKGDLPLPVQSTDVESVVADALRKAPLYSAAILFATAAISRAWPCPVVAAIEVVTRRP